MKKNNWILNAGFDSVFIIFPHFIGLILVVLFPDFFNKFDENIPLAAWVILILFVDVSHVYSTLFRTYFDKIAIKKYSSILWLIPVLSYLFGIVIYNVSYILFWRLLAYIAVFHFIRQQYGFMKIYLKKKSVPEWSLKFDEVIIYMFTFLPILIWHVQGQKKFNWFIKDDFFYFPNSSLEQILISIFYFLSILYLAKECYLFFKINYFNLPKFLIISGTALSWFIGIVELNNDLSFTFLNVVSHGVPYIALVWVYGNKNYNNGSKNPFLQLVFNKKWIFLFITMLFVLAFVEEGLWDGFVWKEHTRFFSFFQNVPNIIDTPFMSLFIPLLSLPQITHYILDGFIWKIDQDNFKWR